MLVAILGDGHVRFPENVLYIYIVHLLQVVVKVLRFIQALENKVNPRVTVRFGITLFKSIHYSFGLGGRSPCKTLRRFFRQDSGCIKHLALIVGLRHDPIFTGSDVSARTVVALTHFLRTLDPGLRRFLIVCVLGVDAGDFGQDARDRIVVFDHAEKLRASGLEGVHQLRGVFFGYAHRVLVDFIQIPHGGRVCTQSLGSHVGSVVLHSGERDHLALCVDLHTGGSVLHILCYERGGLGDILVLGQVGLSFPDIEHLAFNVKDNVLALFRGELSADNLANRVQTFFL
nr:hypothetical protein [Parasutterella excrementihominis]